MEGKEDRRILVHCCCGPCSTSSLERLVAEGWEPTILYANPNIFPHEEFEKRWGELLKVAAAYGIEAIREEPDHGAWREAVKGREDEREGGGRCDLCWAHLLSITAKKAEELGFSHFCTTLTVSRFKPSKRIFAQGEVHEGFESIDFKKKGGFERSVELSKAMGLYRQDWCGCEFSLRDRRANC